MFFAARGCRVTAIDRNTVALAELAGVANVAPLQADIEADPWPLPGERFDAVIVTNYLHRALMPALIAAVADDGVLLYETFARGNEAFGKPSNPDFLLAPGELLTTVGDRLTGRGVRARRRELRRARGSAAHRRGRRGSNLAVAATGMNLAR